MNIAPCRLGWLHSDTISRGSYLEISQWKIVLKLIRAIFAMPKGWKSIWKRGREFQRKIALKRGIVQFSLALGNLAF